MEKEKEKETKWNEMKGNELRFIYFSDFLAFTRRPLALKHEANGFYKELWTKKKGVLTKMKVSWSDTYYPTSPKPPSFLKLQTAPHT